MIDQEAQYDGFYCICTDLLGPADEVIRLNSGRWIVENDFRITRGRILIDNYSDYQIDTLTKGDSQESPLVRFDSIQWHFVEFGLTKIFTKYLPLNL
jgi:hypothetical protein